jgi:hypothetical protein
VPHVLVILAGVLCLAAIWKLEPPITLSRGAPAAKGAGAAPELFVRLTADDEFIATRLTVKIAWDQTLLDLPQAWPTPQTRHAPPQSAVQPGELILTFAVNPDESPDSGPPASSVIAGPIRLARLSFRYLDAQRPLALDALRVVSATATQLDGTDLPLTGLRLLPYEPVQRPGKTDATAGGEKEP